MKKLSLLIATAILIASAPGTRASELEDATHRALEGPDGTSVEVFKHRFAATQPQITEKTKTNHTVTGQLARFNPDTEAEEVISYRILRQKGIKSITLQINGGVWIPISDAVMNALGGYATGKPMPEEEQRAVTRSLEKLANGQWLRAAEILIAHMAAHHC